MIMESALTIIRIKNRFDKSNNAKATASYRDLQMLCYIPGTEMLFEVQLHLRCIHDLKEEAASKVSPDGRTGEPMPAREHCAHARTRVIRSTRCKHNTLASATVHARAHARPIPRLPRLPCAMDWPIVLHCRIPLTMRTRLGCLI